MKNKNKNVNIKNGEEKPQILPSYRLWRMSYFKWYPIR